jgi:hypothetical protein
LRAAAEPEEHAPHTQLSEEPLVTMGKCASSLLPVRLAKLASLVTSLSRACWRCRDFPSLILTTSLLCAPYLTSSTTDLSRRSYRLHHHSRRQLPPFSQRTYLPSPFSSLPYPSLHLSDKSPGPSACVQRASGFWTPPWTRQPSAMDSKASSFLVSPRTT